MLPAPAPAVRSRKPSFLKMSSSIILQANTGLVSPLAPILDKFKKLDAQLANGGTWVLHLSAAHGLAHAQALGLGMPDFLELVAAYHRARPVLHDLIGRLQADSGWVLTPITLSRDTGMVDVCSPTMAHGTTLRVALPHGARLAHAYDPALASRTGARLPPKTGLPRALDELLCVLQVVLPGFAVFVRVDADGAPLAPAQDVAPPHLSTVWLQNRRALFEPIVGIERFTVLLRQHALFTAGQLGHELGVGK